MKLSIIIPIFNTADYLRRCIDSCLNQNISHKDYEVILINDGSTDDCDLICKEYNSNHYNIKYIYQKNSGQSIARNKGLDAAIGEFIWFVDSDDWIEKNVLSAILNICMSENLDILRIGYKKINDDRFINNCNYYQSEDNILITDGKNYFKTDFVFGTPLYIFKKKYLIDNSLYFHPNIFYEDNEFTPKAIYFAKKIGVTENKYYYYYTRLNSTTKTITTKKCFDILTVCKSLINFSHSIDDDLKPFLYNILGTSFNSALYCAIRTNKENFDKFNNTVYLNSEIFNYMKKAIKFKYRIEGVFFSMYPKNVLKLYNIVNLILFRKA